LDVDDSGYSTYFFFILYIVWMFVVCVV
jgi:hypothetical protein